MAERSNMPTFGLRVTKHDIVGDWSCYVDVEQDWLHIGEDASSLVLLINIATLARAIGIWGHWHYAEYHQVWRALSRH